MSGQREIDCPICGREIGGIPHEPRTRWNAQQKWLVRKLDSLGLPRKVIARTVGGSDSGVQHILAEMHRSRAR